MIKLLYVLLYKLHKNWRIFEFLRKSYFPILNNVIFHNVSNKKKIYPDNKNLLQYSKLSKLLF